MKQVILSFLWQHVKKFLSAAILAILWGMWSFIQMPYKASADIGDLKETQAQLNKELRSLQISTGTNSLLLQRVDGKLDKLQESVIKLSVRRRAME